MHIDHEDRKLLAAAEAIVTRASVDWDSLNSDCDPQIVKGLRTIEKLLARTIASERRWPRVGESWNNFEIKGKLGFGGESVVYRAFERSLDRDVALKLRVSRSQLLDAKLAEGQRMAQIDHPNVLKVYGIAEHGGFLGIWCDLIEGEPLAAWVAGGKRLGGAELVVVGVELCGALAAIHGAGLVHGDVKPGNVVRAFNGRYVLIDFGASIKINAADKVRGTPLYTAPEVLVGGSPTTSSDLYSLGALLFRLAAGKPPVNAESFEDLLAAHRRHCRIRLLDLRPDLPSEIVAIVEGALSPDPLSRPKTAGELAAQLAECLPPFDRHKRFKHLTLMGALVVGVILAWAIHLHNGPKSLTQGVGFVRTSAASEAPLKDGATIAPGETFALDISPTRELYAYVLNEDAHGETFQLFPLESAEIKNPLPYGNKIRLPGRVDGKALDWQVTSHGGTERLYILLSESPISELESGKKLSLAGVERAVESMDKVAAPTRGAGGLDTHSPARASVLWLWIQAKLKQDPELQIERIELANP